MWSFASNEVRLKSRLTGVSGHLSERWFHVPPGDTIIIIGILMFFYDIAVKRFMLRSVFNLLTQSFVA